MNERKVGYKRVVHVLPEERGRTEDVEGDAVGSVDDVVSTCARKIDAWWLMSGASSSSEDEHTP